MTHPALDALRRAHDELLVARLELRNGSHEYRAECSEVGLIIESVEAAIADIMLRDFELSPEGREEERALEESRRPYAGGWRVWGG